VDYQAALRGLLYALRDCPCTFSNACQHLHLQLERIGFGKAETLLQRFDSASSGEIEWSQLFTGLQELFVELTASQLAALINQYVIGVLL
jgi:hypothetical protein